MKYILIFFVLTMESIGLGAQQMGKKHDYLWINIVPLHDEHCRELATDLLDLYNNGVITATAFSCSVVPNGNPVRDKATGMSATFEKSRAAIGNTSMPVGILIQSSIGHGRETNDNAPFELIAPGKDDEKAHYMICPLDPGFREYMRQTVRTLAKCHPDFFMLDDDFRLYTSRGGCFCPLHLAEFARRTGRTYTRESLLEAIRKDLMIAREYDKLLEESIVDVAKIIRGAIDEIDPKIPCSFCTCAEDLPHAPAIARALTAPGDFPMVRINNARYLTDSPREYSRWLYSTAVQKNAMPDDFIVISEPDTCLHNRYATSAKILHSHLSMSLLEGCQGGKLWITIMNRYEPESGVAYRKILKKYTGFYNALRNLKPMWHGPTVPIPKEVYSSFIHSTSSNTRFLNWGADVFSKMGIPICYSKSPQGPLLLNGDIIKTFSNEELKMFLSSNVLLDSKAIHELKKRGFGSLISSEKSTDDYQTLFFKNSAGGLIATIPVEVPSFGFGSFDMLNVTRKQQLIDAVNVLEPLALYYPGDGELLMKFGFSDKVPILVVLNVGLDDLEELPLSGTLAATPCSVEMLSDNGKWIPAKLKSAPKRKIIIDTTLKTLEPQVFRFICNTR